MKHMIRRVSPVSVFRISFFLYWMIGIVVAVMYGVFFGIMAMIPGVLDDPDLGGMGHLIGGIGAFALVAGGFFVSILYGVFGATITVLLTLAYNALARTIGGFELDLEERPGTAPTYSDFGLRPPQVASAPSSDVPSLRSSGPPAAPSSGALPTQESADP